MAERRSFPIHVSGKFMSTETFFCRLNKWNSLRRARDVDAIYRCTGDDDEEEERTN